jgi:hypothetical protein
MFFCWIFLFRSYVTQICSAGTWVTPTMQEVVAAMSAVTATNFLILSTICRLVSLAFFVQTAFAGFYEFVFSN